MIATDGNRAKPPTVCLVTPRRDAFSETFVRYHIARLPGNIKVLYGADHHAINEGNRLTFTATEYVLDRVCRRTLHRPVTSLPNWSLRRYLRREAVEVVLAEFGQTGAMLAEDCRSLGIPLVAHFHGADAFSVRWTQPYLAAYRRLFEIARAVVAVSQDMVEQLVRLGAPRHRIHYNPCGVDIEAFVGAQPALQPPRFLAVGRFVPNKAALLILLAFRQVLTHRPQARLVLVGDGALREACMRAARDLGLGEAVEFLGVRTPEQVAGAMREARAFVHHAVQTLDGDSEGTPVSILEAGASGLPVVASRHMGIKDVVIDAETGLLVDEGDVAGMARAMVRLVDEPALAGMLGSRARARIAEHFSMDRSIAALWRIVEDAMAPPGPWRVAT